MQTPTQSPLADRVTARLAARRRQAFWTIWFERVWPAAWPAVGILGAYACLALFGALDGLSPWPHDLALLAALIAAAGLGWMRLRHVRRPTPADLDRRLEITTGLSHRPLATIADRPAASDSAADSLWRAHVARATAQLTRLRVGAPRPGLARLDRRALRGGLMVALVAGLVVAGPDAWPRVANSFTPIFTPQVPPIPPLLQAWITPPAYTRLPPVFLKTDEADVSVPAGSKLTISLTGGGGGEPTLVLNGDREVFRALDPTSWQIERELTQGGRLSVHRQGRDVAGWDLTVVATAPPMIAFSEPPGARARDEGAAGLQTRLPWRVEHQYGVTELHAELRLRDRPDAPPIVVTIPLPGTPKTAHGVAAQDFSAHPWAGLPVVARLVGKDALGQTGRSDDAGFALPERSFRHPLARAILEVRKRLSLHPEARVTAAEDVATLAEAPDAFDNDSGVFLNLAGIVGLLARGRGDDVVDEAQARMWQLALALEENATDRTARALQAAREQLRQAIEEAQRNGTPDQQEIERRTQELREAIQRHLQALAERARRENSELPYDPSAPHMNSRDLDRMAEAAREAARQGHMDEARDRLAELEQLLDQLNAARPDQNQDPQRAERRQRGRQQMGAVEDMVRREGTLLDHAQTRGGDQTLPDRPMPPNSDLPFPGRQSPSQPPAPGQPQGQPQADARRDRGTEGRQQRALRRALGEMMQQYGDLTGQVPPSLGEADTAMREAGEALDQGRDRAAGAAEQRAIEALQKGRNEMGRQLARQFGISRSPGGQGEEGEDDEGAGQAENGPTDGQPGGDQPNARGDQRGERDGLSGRRREGRRDPLGRLTHEGTSGADESDDVRIPDEREQARTREIQEELRRRGADRTRPAQELDYIDRLLRAF